MAKCPECEKPFMMPHAQSVQTMPGINTPGVHVLMFSCPLCHVIISIAPEAPSARAIAQEVAKIKR